MYVLFIYSFFCRALLRACTYIYNNLLTVTFFLLAFCLAAVATHFLDVDLFTIGDLMFIFYRYIVEMISEVNIYNSLLARDHINIRIGPVQRGGESRYLRRRWLTRLRIRTTITVQYCISASLSRLT